MAHNAQLLTNPGQLADPSFNCTYACFSTQQILRSPSELIVLPVSLAYGHFNILLVATIMTGVLGLAAASFGFSLPSSRKRTEDELRAAMHRNRPRQGDPPKLARQKSVRWDRAAKELGTGEYADHSRLGICWSLFSCVRLLVVIVLNEVFLLAYGGGFPYNEQRFAIGQWGPWVGVLLALLAAALVKRREPRWRERQSLLAKEKEALDRRKALWQQRKQSNSPVNNGASVTASVNEDRSKDQVRKVTTVDIEAGIDQTPAIVTTAETFDEVVPQRPIAANPTSHLAKAAANGELETVRMLLEAGTNVNTADSAGLTPLVRAAWAGREDIVRFLVGQGAEVACREGQMAWSRAKASRHVRVAEFLEEHGATSWTDSATREDTKTRR